MGKGQRVRRLSLEREATFPMLVVSGYQVTSAATTQYNCIAHAAGDHTIKWGCPPVSGLYFWPPRAKQGDGVDALMSAYATLGYEECKNSDPEVGFEKIAIYADSNGIWQHAAKLCKNGWWTSKLGTWEDIQHATLDALEGADYGSAVRFMKRPLKRRAKRRGKR